MKPSRAILAKYNGYDNFTHYLLINHKEYYWAKKEELYDIINADSDEIFNYVDSIKLRIKIQLIY